MATYNSQTRSNYFPVKDREAFEKWCEELQFELIEGTEDDSVGFLSDASIPGSRFDEEINDDVEIDFFAECVFH